jgi:uncharacterized protein YdeI (YjbR/CyaY-like superfamily)
MGKKNPRFDEYIAKSPDFAKPILNHLRTVVHEACPEAEEEIKWSNLCFTYKGMFCGMAAFKEHCKFGFWKRSVMLEKDGNKLKEALDNLDRITKISDLPSKKALIEYIKLAKKLNDEGVKAPMRVKKEHPELVVPDDLAKALKRNKAAQATFDNFSPSNKREYVAWITEAKTDVTRGKRLETAIEWMAEGKPRNWKYMNC